jgi:drug/metabolite transporter (DMT)-like permease
MDAPRSPVLRALTNPFFLLALAALTWSGNHVVGRAIAGAVPPYALSTLRWAIPVPILFVLARPHLAGDWPAIRRHWPAMLGLGLGGGAVFSAMQYVGLQYTTALNVSVLNSLAPVMIVAAGAALFRERLSGRQLAGIGLSLAGVLVIVTKADLGTLTLLAFDVGDLIIFGNMMIWAIYSVCLRFAPRIHWLTFAFVLALVSALGTLPAMVWEHASGYRLQGNLETVLAVAYVAIFPSVVGYAAWNRGVSAIGAGRAGAFLYIIPLYSAVLASVFLGERLMAFHVAGFAAIVAGVTLAARRGG